MKGLNRARATMKAQTERAKKSNCVRFNDMHGCDIRLNKTGFRSSVEKKLFSYYVKCYEQLSRGEPASAVLKKYGIFRSVYDRFPPLTPLPARFELLKTAEKHSTLKRLVSEQLDAAERICLQFQVVDTQANFPDDMQVGEGSGPDPASEGVANTSPPPDDSSLQNVPLGSVRSEGSPGFPPGFSLGLGNWSGSQLDNPEGRPPPSFRQCLDQFMSDIKCRASGYPDLLAKLDWSEQELILRVEELKDRELNERLSLESRSNLLRRSLGEIPSRLPEGILDEDPQNQLRKASMEDAGFKDGFQDVGFQGSYYPASDIGVKKIETPILDGEEDGLLRNQSISEALEVVPRLTGRYRKNVGDIRPEVYGGSADGDLSSKAIMEGFSPQASDLQDNDLCSGEENFVIMPNHGENNTLQSVPINHFVPAEPSADERELWAEQLLYQIDMPVEQDWRYLWHSPVRHVSIDTLPA